MNKKVKLTTSEEAINLRSEAGQSLKSTDPLFHYINGVVNKVTGEIEATNAGKLSFESMSKTDAKAVADIMSKLKTAESVKGFNESLNSVASKVCEKLISGEGAFVVPGEWTKLFNPIVKDIQNTRNKVANDRISSEAKEYTLGFLGRTLHNCVKSELIRSYESASCNPAMTLSGEAMGNLGSAREFRLLETAVQYGNTVRVVFNKIAPTEVYADTIDIPYTKVDTFVLFEEGGEEKRVNVLEYYTDPAMMQKVGKYLDGSQEIEVTTDQITSNNGLIDLTKSPWSMKKSNEEAMITSLVITKVKVQNSEGGEKTVDLTKSNSADDAYLLRAGAISLFKTIKVPKNDDQTMEDFQFGIAGEARFNEKVLHLAFTNSKLKAVYFQTYQANDMYNRSISFDTVQEVMNFTIKHTHRVDLTYNPRMIQIYNKAARTNLMNNLIARSSENISHHKEQNWFDEKDRQFARMKKIDAELQAAGKVGAFNSHPYAEETVEATYYEGQEFMSTVKSKIAYKLNKLYFAIRQKINNKSGFAFASIIAPELQSYLTNVAPVIQKQPTDTTVAGLFSGLPVDSPVMTYALESGDTANGALRGIAVSSDKLTDAKKMEIIPLIQDPNLVNFTHVEMPTIVYSNNEIRPLRGRGINVHIEALYDTFAINPTLCQLNIEKIMEREIARVQPVAVDK